MNANYLYDIFETATKNDQPLEIAIEILRGINPIPDGMTKQEINEFVGLHYDPLWRAYQTHNRKLFADIVAVCIKTRDHEEEALKQAFESGNEKLIAEYEAKYGDDHV